MELPVHQLAIEFMLIHSAGTLPNHCLEMVDHLKYMVINGSVYFGRDSNFNLHFNIFWKLLYSKKLLVAT